MPCFYCGKRVSLVRQLTDADFCSDEHRKRYHELTQMALNRLMEAHEQLAAAPKRKHRTAAPVAGAEPTPAVRPEVAGVTEAPPPPVNGKRSAAVLPPPPVPPFAPQLPTGSIHPVRGRPTPLSSPGQPLPPAAPSVPPLSSRAGGVALARSGFTRRAAAAARCSARGTELVPPPQAAAKPRIPEFRVQPDRPRGEAGIPPPIESWRTWDRPLAANPAASQRAGRAIWAPTYFYPRRPATASLLVLAPAPFAFAGNPAAVTSCHLPFAAAVAVSPPREVAYRRHAVQSPGSRTAAAAFIGLGAPAALPGLRHSRHAHYAGFSPSQPHTVRALREELSGLGESWVAPACGAIPPGCAGARQARGARYPGFGLPRLSMPRSRLRSSGPVVAVPEIPSQVETWALAHPPRAANAATVLREASARWVPALSYPAYAMPVFGTRLAAAALAAVGLPASRPGEGNAHRLDFRIPKLNLPQSVLVEEVAVGEVLPPVHAWMTGRVPAAGNIAAAAQRAGTGFVPRFVYPRQAPPVLSCTLATAGLAAAGVAAVVPGERSARSARYLGLRSRLPRIPHSVLAEDVALAEVPPPAEAREAGHLIQPADVPALPWSATTIFTPEFAYPRHAARARTGKLAPAAQAVLALPAAAAGDRAASPARSPRFQAAPLRIPQSAPVEDAFAGEIPPPAETWTPGRQPHAADLATTPHAVNAGFAPEFAYPRHAVPARACTLAAASLAVAGAPPAICGQSGARSARYLGFRIPQMHMPRSVPASDVATPEIPPQAEFGDFAHGARAANIVSHPQTAAAIFAQVVAHPRLPVPTGGGTLGATPAACTLPAAATGERAVRAAVQRDWPLLRPRIPQSELAEEAVAADVPPPLEIWQTVYLPQAAKFGAQPRNSTAAFEAACAHPHHALSAPLRALGAATLVWAVPGAAAGEFHARSARYTRFAPPAVRIPPSIPPQEARAQIRPAVETWQAARLPAAAVLAARPRPAAATLLPPPLHMPQSIVATEIAITQVPSPLDGCRSLTVHQAKAASMPRQAVPVTAPLALPGVPRPLVALPSVGIGTELVLYDTTPVAIRPNALRAMARPVATTWLPLPRESSTIRFNRLDSGGAQGSGVFSAGFEPSRRPIALRGGIAGRFAPTAEFPAQESVTPCSTLAVGTLQTAGLERLPALACCAVASAPVVPGPMLGRPNGDAKLPLSGISLANSWMPAGLFVALEPPVDADDQRTTTCAPPYGAGAPEPQPLPSGLSIDGARGLGCAPLIGLAITARNHAAQPEFSARFLPMPPKAFIAPAPLVTVDYRIGFRPIMAAESNTNVLTGVLRGARMVKSLLLGGSALMVLALLLFSSAGEPLRQRFQSRAAIRVEEDFRSELRGWFGGREWARNWSRDNSGFMRVGQLALYRPSMQLTDYRLEFLGQINNRSMGWVFRAVDLGNYYAMRLVVTKAGPLPSVALDRWAVVAGQEEQHVQVPVRTVLENGKAYRVSVNIVGNGFTTSFGGKVVDFWSDDRFKSGGVGLFGEREDRPHFYWVKVSHQDDLWGKVCALIAPSSDAFAGRDQ